MKIAIYVPSYQFRYTYIIKELNKLFKLNDKDRQVDMFIVLSKNDLNKSSYYNLKVKNELDSNIHILEFDVKSIAEKRQCMHEYLYKHGYDYAIHMDDDVNKFAKITPESKRSTSDSYAQIKIDVVEFLNHLIDETLKNNASFASTILTFNLGLSCPGKIKINRGLNCGQLTMINIKDIIENNIKFCYDEFIHEDIELVINILQKGLKCITLADYGFNTVPKSQHGLNSTISEVDNGYKFKCNLYIKYRDNIRLFINKKYGDLRASIKFSKFYCTEHINIIDDEYHNKLYELCKKYDNESILKLIQKSKEHKK